MVFSKWTVFTHSLNLQITFIALILIVILKKHHRYVSAKAGGPDASLILIKDIALDCLKSLKNAIPEKCFFVSPYAHEATGVNAIPLILSLACAVIFEGVVIKDANYILVDDVTCLGTTLAELSNYIQINGGNVVGTITLANSGRSKEFTAAKKHINILNERFKDGIKEIFGIKIESLTANEASYLVGFRTIEEIRNRRVKAEKEIHKRLVSKGYI